MNAIGLSELWLVLLSLLGAPPVGITLPNQPAPDPAADAARFQAVTGQLDPGGVVHAYVSVDGDLTAIAGYVNSMMDEFRKIEPDVPAVNVPALLRVTGLDAVSAMGFSSVRIEDGFRNKTYIHTPNGRRGLLRLMGGDSKPFQVLNLAPAGSDFVIEQDLNFKTLYESVVEGAGVVMGEQGKAMVQMGLKQPMPPPITFLDRWASSMKARLPSRTDPTGVPSPFERHREMLSNRRPYWVQSSPVVLRAFHALAPSR